MCNWGCDTAPAMTGHDWRLHYSGYIKKELNSYLLLYHKTSCRQHVNVYHTYVKLLIDGFCPQEFSAYHQSILSRHCLVWCWSVLCVPYIWYLWNIWCLDTVVHSHLALPRCHTFFLLTAHVIVSFFPLANKGCHHLSIFLPLVLITPLQTSLSSYVHF